MPFRRSNISVKSNKRNCLKASKANRQLCSYSIAAEVQNLLQLTSTSSLVGRNYRRILETYPATGRPGRRRFLSWNAAQVTGAQRVTSHFAELPFRLIPKSFPFCWIPVSPNSHFAEFPCHSYLAEIPSHPISQPIKAKWPFQTDLHLLAIGSLK